MKKFLLIALAVAFGATTALAGDFAAKGTYVLEGMQNTLKFNSGTPAKLVDSWYQNDFELVTTFTQGNVTATVDWEIVDSNRKELAGYTIARHSNSVSIVEAGSYVHEDIIDNYFITWKVDDALTIKTGKYGLGWGKRLFISDVLNSTAKSGVVGYNIAATYSLTSVDLGLTICKIAEGFDITDGSKDADVDAYLFSAALKGVGPFTKLNFYALALMAQKGWFIWGPGVYTYPSWGGSPNYSYGYYDSYDLNDSGTATFIAGEFAVPIGPVALSGEFGFMGGDIVPPSTSTKTALKGNYLELEAGLSKLVGFDFNVGLLYSNKDATSAVFGENWSPFLILGNGNATSWDYWDGSNQPALNVNNGNKTLLWVSGGYAVNDKLTVGGAILPYARVTKAAAGADKAIGTEIDITATYKFADNVTYMAGVGMFNAGDSLKKVAPLYKSDTLLYNKLSFNF